VKKKTPKKKVPLIYAYGIILLVVLVVVVIFYWQIKPKGAAWGDLEKKARTIISVNEAVRLKQQGLSTDDIQREIDQMWKEGKLKYPPGKMGVDWKVGLDGIYDKEGNLLYSAIPDLSQINKPAPDSDY